MSHGYTACPGNPKNRCAAARKCPWHGDAEACAAAVGLTEKQKAKQRKKVKP